MREEPEETKDDESPPDLLVDVIRVQRTQLPYEIVSSSLPLSPRGDSVTDWSRSRRHTKRQPVDRVERSENDLDDYTGIPPRAPPRVLHTEAYTEYSECGIPYTRPLVDRSTDSS